MTSKSGRAHSAISASGSWNCSEQHSDSIFVHDNIECHAPPPKRVNALVAAMDREGAQQCGLDPNPNPNPMKNGEGIKEGFAERLVPANVE
jgi:hypothetical protein